MVLLASCPGSMKTITAVENRPMCDEKVGKLVSELQPVVTVGFSVEQSKEARAELAELAADWLREIGEDADAPAVLALLRKELLERIAGRSPAERRDILRWQSLQRRVRRLSVQSYALGQQVVDGTIPPEQARAEGERIIAAIDGLAPRWQGVVDAQAKATLQRDIQEVRMEALYAVERKAMSVRLGRYAAGRDGGPKITP